MLFDDEKALEAHSNWPTGTVHRKLHDDASDPLSVKERRRERDRTRQAKIRAYAKEHGVTDLVARKHFRESE